MPINVNIPLSREFLLNRNYCCNLNCKNCPYKLHIDKYLNSLYTKWKFTTDQLNDIKLNMAMYANDIIINNDTKIENESILNSIHT